jgi:hypothetical protein
MHPPVRYSAGEVGRGRLDDFPSFGLGASLGGDTGGRLRGCFFLGGTVGHPLEDFDQVALGIDTLSRQLASRV